MIGGKMKFEGIYTPIVTPYDDNHGINYDAIEAIVDDLIATGGTAKASVELIEKIGGNVAGFAFVIELADLKGVDLLKDYEIYSLVKYHE